jgi:tetraacyldisaccharide 4'-kinase
MPLPLLGELPAAIARARRRYVTSRPDLRRRLARPVVSVGNLSVGGRGKTPLVQWLASWLRDEGWRPAILSRGYGRAELADGVVVVSDGLRLRADLARAGDEPLLLARTLPGVAVVVCPDRHLAGRVAETHLGCTIHVLDDGFQHLALERTVDLVLVDPDDLAAPGVLPFGRLREPVDSLRAADGLLWTGTGDADAAAARLGVADVFRAVRTPGPLTAGAEGGDPPAPGARVVAVTGIARPEQFTVGLRADGYDVAKVLSFGDHHRFTAADLGRVRQAIESTGAAGAVTTEKDWVRLLPLRPLGLPVAWRGLSVAIDPVEPFAAWLRARIGRPGGREAAS